MNAPNPGDSSLSAPFEVERVEWVPSSAEVLEVQVSGRWREGTPEGHTMLVVDDAGERRPFVADVAVAGEDGHWSARYAVPVELRVALSTHLALNAAGREISLPAASPGPADESDAPPPATVVDSGVLEQRRARRDSHADEGVVRRAQAAEATVATLETQLGHLEGRLRETLTQRDALTARLRAAEQAEEAERRVRGEVQDERDEVRERADREIAQLRGRVVAAEEHAAALAEEMDAIRREGAEAQHAAAAARVAAERALSRAGEAGAQAELDRLGRESAALASQLETQRVARSEAELALARQADRVAEVEATVSLLESELDRRASIQTAVQGELESLRAALADVRARAGEESARESGALRALAELKAIAMGLRERVIAVEEAERVARAQVRETQAELAARDGDLGRLRVELERGRAELASAHARQDGVTAALRDAERTVVAVRQEAAELQSRLEDERRRRFEAEASLKVEIARERERFGEQVADIEAELRARISAERSAFEAQAASIEALVSGLRARLASVGTELDTRLGEHERARDEAFAARDAAIADAQRVKRSVLEDLQRAAVEREELLARVAAVEAELAGARPAIAKAELALAEAEAAGRSAVAAALAEGEAAVAEAVTAGDGALAQARAQTESRVREIGAELANRLVEVEVERDALLVTLADREEELVLLRAAAVDGETRSAAIEALVADVVQTAAGLRGGHDRRFVELTERVETELRTLRAQLDEERTARWVAEQELAVERERGTEPGTFLTASLNRTELDATRRELAAAQEQLAAEHLRQSASAGPASKLVRDLEAAGARLKEGVGDEPGDAPDVVPVVDGTAAASAASAASADIAAAASDQAAADDVSQDSGIPTSSRDALAAALAALTASTPPATAEAGDAPDPASMRPADAVAAAFAAAAAGGDEAGPSPDDPDPARPVLLAPPAGATPLSPRVVRAFERPQVGWLAPAIAKLAKEDEKLAAELIVELLPGQAGVVRDQLAYGVTIDGHGSYRVAISAERALVEPREGAFWPDDVEASISGSPAALAPLVAGLARRKLSGTKLDGRKRRLRKVLRGRRGPVDLGQLAERGIRPSPEPLLAVLAAAVEPTWTAGHSFVVVYALAGGKAIEVEVRNGQPLRIQTGVRAPTEPPAATIALRDVALLPLLAHTDPPAGERVFVAGDRHAVALLHSWFDRAQGLPGA